MMLEPFSVTLVHIESRPNRQNDEEQDIFVEVLVANTNQVGV
jgi:hypothetical protein